ncbi:MAG: DNA replication protein DnaD [Firmicutes bacterium]|nr:DNA replication protein DnaD [Bacillota bacterium]
MCKGWISLHREIQDHWLYKEKRKFSKYEAWIDLLLMANHTDKKVLIGNELILVKRGQLITSELKLMKKWDWSKTKLRSFLDLLEKDGMAIKESDSKKTTITIVKYNDWQIQGTAERPRRDREKTAKELRKDTNNNVNNYNNDNKYSTIANEKIINELNKAEDEVTSSLEGKINNNDFIKLAQAYSKCIGHPDGMTPKWLQNILDEYGLEWCLNALEEANLNGIRTKKYVNGILYNWNRNGGMKLSKDRRNAEDGHDKGDTGKTRNGRGPSAESLRLERIAKEKGLIGPNGEVEVPEVDF